MKDKEVKESMHSDHTMDLPKRDKGKKVWMIIAIIAIIALIGLGGYGYMQMKKLNQKISNQQTQIDELNDKKKTLEDAAAAAAKATTDAAKKAVTNAVAGQTEDQQITTAATNYAIASDVKTKSAKVTIVAKQGNFARVSVQPSDASTQAYFGVYFLKKVNDSWVVVKTSNNTLSPEEAATLGFPSI